MGRRDPIRTTRAQQILMAVVVVLIGAWVALSVWAVVEVLR